MSGSTPTVSKRWPATGQKRTRLPRASLSQILKETRLLSQTKKLNNESKSGLLMSFVEFRSL
ncbi:hypothetical protein [Mesorhizobium sp. LSHC440B00]|uniref:hypothetical protein n=1 Tax=Mesorhizobium sp. LSHC440B00 TaxID=1287308 RepID=UPI0012EB4593|nr:hypothetical protein [Mesorhizobium sp. LSHC440B00]